MGKWTEWLHEKERTEYEASKGVLKNGHVSYYTNGRFSKKDTPMILKDFVEYLNKLVEIWENSIKDLKNKNNIYRNNNYYD